MGKKILREQFFSLIFKFNLYKYVIDIIQVIKYLFYYMDNILLNDIDDIYYDSFQFLCFSLIFFVYYKFLYIK